MVKYAYHKRKVSVNMKQCYKPKEFAEMINVSVRTLQRWDYEGKLKAYRSKTDRRFYTQEQYEEYMGISKQSEGKTVIYARVSSQKQSDDLKNQVTFLREFANAKGWIVDDCIEDIGSGLNYNRKKWNHLLNDCFEHKVSNIIIAHKDRFIRFGYDWFERFLKEQCGVTITVVNNESLSPEQEMIQDLISIIHVFSCRIYGLRKYGSQLKGDDSLAKSV